VAFSEIDASDAQACSIKWAKPGSCLTSATYGTHVDREDAKIFTACGTGLLSHQSSGVAAKLRGDSVTPLKFHGSLNQIES
jgi:hypothetical protein